MSTFLLERQSHWAATVWQENIEAPVMEQYSNGLADLKDVEADAAHNLSSGNIVADGNQLPCEASISLSDLAFLIEEDDAVAKDRVKEWVDGKRIKATSIGKCHSIAANSCTNCRKWENSWHSTPEGKAKYRPALRSKLRTTINF